VVCSTYVLLDIEESTQLLGQICSEMGVSVRDDLSWCSIVWKHMFHVELCGVQGINGLVTGDKDGGLCGIVVSDGEDGVKALRYWEVSDEVHGHSFKWHHFCNRSDRERGCSWSHGVHLATLTGGAAFDIIRDKIFDCWPPIISCEEVQSF
jgi:hypothetical protein